MLIILPQWLLQILSPIDIASRRREGTRLWGSTYAESHGTEWLNLGPIKLVIRQT